MARFKRFSESQTKKVRQVGSSDMYSVPDQVVSESSPPASSEVTTQPAFRDAMVVLLSGSASSKREGFTRLEALTWSALDSRDQFMLERTSLLLWSVMSDVEDVEVRRRLGVLHGELCRLLARVNSTVLTDDHPSLNPSLSSSSASLVVHARSPVHGSPNEFRRARSFVLEYLGSSGPLTMWAIACATPVHWSVVEEVLNDLFANGFVCVVETPPGKVGQWWALTDPQPL